MNGISSRPSTHGVLGARQHALLALGTILFALYASVVPLNFRFVPLADALQRFREVCTQPISIDSKSDWLANILLMVPVAYLLTGWLLVDRTGRSRLWAVVVVPACAAVAAGLEFSQLYFPPRVSSINDIVAQTVGAAAGVVFWLVAGPWLTIVARTTWDRVDDGRRAVRLFPAYLFLLLLFQTLPLDLTISPKDLYRKYRTGGVGWLPSTLRSGDMVGLATREFWELLCFVPLGLLAAHFPGAQWRRWAGWSWVLALGLAVAGVIECAQLFVASRSCTAADIPVGAAAALAGWAAAVRLEEQVSWSGIRPWLLAGWVVVAVFLNWQPFHFATDSATAWGRLWEASWVPLAEYGAGDPLTALEDFVHKAALFALLGALLAPREPLRPGSWAARAVLVPAAVAACLEVGQVWLPTRYASLSDVLVGTFGATVGFALAQRIWTSADRPEPARPVTGRPYVQ